MFVTLGVFAVAVVGANRNADVSVGFAAPLIIDLFFLYIVGAYLGVLPVAV